MNDLGPNWHPNFGTIYTWYAMDRNGKISMMINNILKIGVELNSVFI